MFSRSQVAGMTVVDKDGIVIYFDRALDWVFAQYFRDLSSETLVLNNYFWIGLGAKRPSSRLGHDIAEKDRKNKQSRKRRREHCGKS